MNDTRPARRATDVTRAVRRVVIGCDDTRRSVLMRLGLDMSGRFEVVATAVDAVDLPSTVRRHGADIVVLGFTGADACDAIALVHAVAPRALVVRVPVDRTVRPASFAAELVEQLAMFDGVRTVC